MFLPLSRRICLAIGAVLALGLPVAGRAAQSGSASTSFVIGTEPAAAGKGYSYYSSARVGSQRIYKVTCDCDDLTVALSSCQSLSYVCSCMPRAQLSCG
ncbi:hypothetical protein FGG78_28420 [Thioclava sp. BHET1]|nr:hypothetical protein FGG78_28420 [Thioclava sp. BHET1]